MSCPFASRKGYSTLETQKEHLKYVDQTPVDVDLGLDANMDQTKPLYFWQLISIWGQVPIVDICESFYKSVYAVSEENGDEAGDIELKQAFQRLGVLQHHINAQAAYWIDAFGGGKYYHGGLYRLRYHHKNRAGPRVMTADGAKRWMRHMHKAIQENHKHFEKDHRILPCLITFLETKMKSYAELHEFEFDASDFEVEKFKPQLQQ